MQSKGPNLYIIGVQKAGTTSFYNWLGNNENIVTGYNLKDSHTLFEKNAKEIYDKKFIKTGKYYLDASVNYFFFDERFLKKTNHSEKILLFLRNPIDRALSAYNYNYMTGREKRDLREAFDYKWRADRQFKRNYSNSNFTYVEHGLYYQRLKKIGDKFNDNLKVYIFEEIINDKENFTNDISSFLNIKLNNNIQKDNKSKNIRSYYFSKFINNKHPLKDFFKKIMNKKMLNKLAGIFKKLNYTKEGGVKVKLNKDIYKKLYSFYSADITKTSQFLDKDLKKIWFK